MSVLAIVASVAGLLLDAFGVLLLGWDLVRSQKFLRSQSETRSNIMSEIGENNRAVAQQVEELEKGNEWRDWHWEEGRPEYHGGTFDSSAAQSTISGMLELLRSIGSDLARSSWHHAELSQMDSDHSGRSLKMSYLGLALIVVGFLFQIIGLLVR